MRGGDVAGAPFSAIASTSTPSAVHLRRMGPPGERRAKTTELPDSLRAAARTASVFFCNRPRGWPKRQIFESGYRDSKSRRDEDARTMLCKRNFFADVRAFVLS